MEDTIPIFGIFMIVAIVLGPIWLNLRYRTRDRERMHDTLKLAYERGQPVPPEIIATLQNDRPKPAPERDLRTGIILLAVALAMITFGSILGRYEDEDAFAIFAGMAAFPGFVGLGFLAFWLAKRGTA